MILVTVGHNTGLTILFKLLNLGYNAEEIVCTTYNIQPNVIDLLTQQTKIKFLSISCLQEIESIIHENNFLFGINISGIPTKLPMSAIEKFKLGVVNLHTADTQVYRGRWCASWSIIDNLDKTAYTWHYMNKEFDTGNVLCKGSVKIDITDTAFFLHNKILSDAIEAFDEAHKKLLEKNIGVEPQANGVYKTASIPFNGTINNEWNEDAIEKFIRAMYYPPYPPAKWIDKTGNTHYITSLQQYKELKSR